jgi:hypothetical protein
MFVLRPADMAIRAGNIGYPACAVFTMAFKTSLDTTCQGSRLMPGKHPILRVFASYWVKGPFGVRITAGGQSKAGQQKEQSTYR